MKWLARLGWMMAGFVLNVVVLAALYIMCFAFDSPVADKSTQKPATAKMDGLLSLETSVAELKRTIDISNLTPYRFSDGQMGWCYTLPMGDERIVKATVEISERFKPRLYIASWMLRQDNDEGWYPGKRYGWMDVANSLGCPPDYADLRAEKEPGQKFSIVLLIRDKHPATETEAAKVHEIEGQQDREQEYLARHKNADQPE